MIVDGILFFVIFVVLPFAWMLRDGLGPSSISTTGLDAVYKIFMSFYVGPVILLLASFDLLIRRQGPPETSAISRRLPIAPIAIALMLVALGFIMFSLM
ncbi:hypothetical protein N9B94_01085 [Verrucomicrobia bacterium]|nr:hypothetical protein [Verrucomicrobiota bacterium]